MQDQQLELLYYLDVYTLCKLISNIFLLKKQQKKLKYILVEDVMEVYVIEVLSVTILIRINGR